MKTPARYSTAIQRCTSPGAKAFGKFYVVGSVPATCVNTDGSKMIFETEAACLAAILASDWIKATPDQTIQMADCSVYQRKEAA